MPDAFWHVFGDNPLMLGVMIVGLAGVVLGPWAIVRAVARPPKADPET